MHDERIDAYIVGAEGFARPVLTHLRQLVHATIPDATETIKWGMPFFEMGGKRLAMMAVFKAHVGLGIFDGSPMASGDGMGQFGKLTGLADLPPDAELAARLQAAAALIASGAPSRPRAAAPKPALAMPDDLAAALASDAAAQAAFAGFPPGARRLCRMGGDRQAAGDTGPAHRHHRRAMCRGQKAALEVRELLNVAARPRAVREGIQRWPTRHATAMARCWPMATM